MIKFEQWKETADIDELWKEFMEEMEEDQIYTDDDFDDFLLNRYESELDSYYDQKYEMSKEEL